MPAKLLSLLLALLLILCLGGAQAAEYTAPGLFTVTYDEQRWTADCAAYHGESTPEARWLFMLYSDDMLIDVEAATAAGYAVQTLVGADAGSIERYIDDMAFVGCTHLDTITVGEIPFVLFEMEDEEGPYLMAETVANGWCIDFYAYYDQGGPADEKLAEALREVLGTFEPCR